LSIMSKLSVPLRGEKTEGVNGHSYGSELTSWIREGIPVGEGNQASGSFSMKMVNAGVDAATIEELWILIMRQNHKRGWSEATERDKVRGDIKRAQERVKSEQIHKDAEEGWTESDLASVDENFLPLGELGPDGIIYDHGVYWLYGGSGDGKTVVAYYIAIERARAGHVVAVLDDEMGLAASARLFRDLGATDDDLNMIHYVHREDGDTPNLVQMGGSLGEFLDGIKADMLIIDCMNAFLSAADLSDNHSNDIRKLLQSAVYPSRNDGRAVVIIDHKGHAKDETRARGSSDKMPGCDMMIGLECPATFQEGQSGYVILTCDKDRNAKVKGKQLQVDMRVDGRDIRAAPSHWFDFDKATPNKVPDADPYKVIDAILEANPDGIRNIEITEISGFTAGKVSGLLDRGKKAGKYVSKNGFWYIA
jgi:hypothetical protein